MLILGIDTSCDETAAAVTDKTTVLSNVIWSQATQHANFGGVVPSIAKRMHEERIDLVIEEALKRASRKIADLEAIAITTGPGLAIALGVGIQKAKELAGDNNLPLMPINHVEGHLLSPLAKPKQRTGAGVHTEEECVDMPALGLVVSGGHTELILIQKIGRYRILAKTQDDALGEALDKGARMLGLGYPGGEILEKMAKEGDPRSYPLPLPMSGREDLHKYSYSGLKTAFYRLIHTNQPEQEAQQIKNLAASFQARAFEHLIRISERTIQNLDPIPKTMLVGGGVAANSNLRRRLRQSAKKFNIRVMLPYTKKLTGDNAAMIGVAAYLKIKFQKSNNLSAKEYFNYPAIDRKARWSIEDV